MADYNFTKTVTIDLLTVEIKAEISGLKHLETVGDALKIFFVQPITNEQFLLLGDVVNSHVPSSCPTIVSSRQMKKALSMAGKIPMILDFIAALPEPDKTLTEIEWNSSQEFQRFNPFLISMAGQMGLTFQEIENLFILAGTL